jgi:hypothetical protein
MMVKTAFALALLLPFTAVAAEPVVPAPVAAPMPPMPADAGNKPGFLARLFSDGPGPAAMPAPTAIDTGFGKVDDDAGTWTINMMPTMGTVQQCTASFMPKAPAPSPNAPVAAMMQQNMNVNISRMRGDAIGPTQPADTLQYSISVMAMPKDETSVMTVDGAKIGRVTMRNMNMSVSGEVTDLPALRKTLAAGNKVAFAAGDQKMVVAAGTMAALLKKMDACLDKAAKQAK